MKKLLTLLLIISSVITINAQRTKSQAQITPTHVKALFSDIIKNWGSPSDEVFSVNRNPNTNLIESSVRITYFVADNAQFATAGKKSLNLNDIREAFRTDEPISYQLLNLSPGSNESFSLKAVDGNGKNKSYLVRGLNKEEMWLLCTKNAENPELRDAYAIKWTLSDDKRKILGGIYQITSLRPDIYEKNLESSKKMFKIEGRVDANIKDSLYNIYIANSAEELENIGDDDYVACVPVINKRFEWQTELEHPVAGRLRCIFPDGSLCSAWINLDFVPGETYRITVHNGYYDEDQDYERRVGRRSGKSLLNRRQSLGIDDVKVEDPGGIDTVVIDTVLLPTNVHHASEDFKPTSEMKAQVMKIMMTLNPLIEATQSTYESLEPFKEMRSLAGSEMYFIQITKLNKEVNGKFQELIKYLNGVGVPAKEKAELYGHILEFYANQNKEYTKLYKEVGVLPEFTQRAQNYVNRLMEKYMKDIKF
jgi:hypothetical protein